MAANKRTNSQKKPRGKGKPFQPDNPETGEKDPRINRKGPIKPRAQRELEDLLDEIFDEEIEITEGGKAQKMTQLKAGLIGLWRNKNIIGRINLVERRFGKMPQAITGAGGKDLIPKEVDDTRAEILRKLDGIAAATGADKVSKQSDK